MNEGYGDFGIEMLNSYLLLKADLLMRDFLGQIG